MNPALVRKTCTACGLFAAGYVAALAGTPYATSVNTGLVRALDAVGKDLFGNAVFGSAAPNVIPSDPIRIDVASDSRIGAAPGVFTPTDPIAPCRRVAQQVLRPPLVGESGPQLTLYASPGVVSVLNVEPPDPIRPDVARCGASN